MPIRLALLALTLAPLSASATGISRPALTIVDAQCRPAKRVAPRALMVTWGMQHMVCAPRSPDRTNPGCTPSSSTPSAPEALRVRVEGCEALLDGAFVATERTCGGLPVLRFDGRVPAGQRLRIEGTGQFGMQATVRTRGRGRYRCPKPARVGPPKRWKTNRDGPGWIPASAFVVKGRRISVPARPMYSFLWGDPIAGQLTTPWAQVLETATRHTKTGALELAVDLSNHFESQTWRAGKRQWCEVAERVEAVARIKGTAQVLRGTQTRSHPKREEPCQ